MKNKIIEQIVKEAVFYSKPLKLKEEGTTRSSIENAMKIMKAGYHLLEDETRYDWNKNLRTNKLVATFENESGHKETHEFLGFNWGYNGEGPRGLKEFSKIFKLRLDPNKIDGTTPINFSIEVNVDYGFPISTWR